MCLSKPACCLETYLCCSCTSPSHSWRLGVIYNLECVSMLACKFGTEYLKPTDYRGFRMWRRASNSLEWHDILSSDMFALVQMTWSMWDLAGEEMGGDLILGRHESSYKNLNRAFYSALSLPVQNYSSVLDCFDVHVLYPHILCQDPSINLSLSKHWINTIMIILPLISCFSAQCWILFLSF